MDWILLGICLFFSIKGWLKGFISTLFSICGTFLIIYLSWQFSDVVTEFLKKIFDLESFFTEVIDSKILVTFSNIQELQSFIQNEFVFAILLKLVGNISFEGNLTAGEILSPSISNLVYKIISFIILFFCLMIILYFVKFIINKIITFCHFSFLNRSLGFCVGILQGLLIFGVIFFLFSVLANFLLNEELLNFINSGVVSQFVYNNIIIKGIDFLI